MERLKQFRDSNWAGLALVLLYAIIGLFIFADYGISTDEMPQLRRSHAAYHYVFRGILERSESEGVQAFVERTPLLTSNPDSPYHGVALQMPLVAIEHLRDFQMSDDQVFRMRHAFNFLNYAMAGFFFFLILKRRFPKSPIPLLGLLMYMVYPRL
ncbi:MAG: hypothetical protein FWC72_05610, partial [Oscillospiraceae bacterium]|nr:hypothetical protein [Oscillospiraceae bacterium]